MSVAEMEKEAAARDDRYVVDYKEEKSAIRK
jgi:hypothetical protein